MILPHRLRLQDISRWGIVATQRTQSVAEHTLNVVFILRHVLEQVNQPDLFDGPKLTMAALEHDLGEVFTGDIPTPAKKSGAVEVKSEWKSLWGESLEQHEAKLLKAVDIMEAIHFLNNFGAGNRAQNVEDDLMDKFTSAAMWFEQHSMQEVSEELQRTIYFIIKRSWDLE